MEMNLDVEGLHRIEEELHVDIVPGTEVMRDVGHLLLVKGKFQVLVPQPSNDPHDPLNWSIFWKGLATISATSVSFTQGLGPLALAPMFPYYIKDFDSNLADVVKFTGVAILVLGFSNFLWVPLGSSLGRRPVYIFSQLICLASAIWRAKATTYGSFMGACVLNGFAAGPAESIQPVVIADIFFLHERGFWNTVYWVSYMGSLMVGPIISGTMSQHVGWRSFWQLYIGMVALSLVMVIFMFPETKWHRPHPSEVVEKSASSEERIEKVTCETGPMKEKGDVIADTAVPIKSSIPITTANNTCLGRGKPSRSQWGIYTASIDPWKAAAIDIWTPWRLFAFPIVEFASFVISWSCSCLLTLNLTQSQNFAGPPYNYQAQTIGFMNFAIFAGALIGLATAGRFSDWVSARATRKNNGIREPEMRLPAMIPYVLIMILGNFIVAFGYEQKWSWAPIVIVGYTCIGIQVTALTAMVNTYAIDSYKPVAGSVMVAITVNKNVWGYGFSEYLTPWIEKSGFVKPIMCNMTLTILWCMFGVVFYFYGKTFRRWTANSSVHQM